MNRILSSLGLCLLLGLTACQEKPAARQASEQAPMPALDQGMRAYVDPVTGEYAPPPPQAPAAPAPAIPGAAIVSPKPPVEIPVPKGGVMIELGDRFQTEGQASE